MKIFKLFLAAFLLFTLFLLVDLTQLWQALSNLGWDAIIYLSLLAVVLIYVSVFKWHLFLQELGARIATLRLFTLYLVGYFFNAVMPSYVGGDVVRSFYAGKQVGQHEALAATILERYTGLVAMVALALGAMWWVEGVTLEIKICVVALALGVVGITTLGLSPLLVNWVERIPLSAGLVPHLRKVQAGFHLARRNQTLLFGSILLSVVFHLLAAMNTVVAAYAVGWGGVPFWDLCVVLPIILLVGALPLTPSGLGLQEGAFFYFLQGVGATPAQALGVGLILRAKTYVLALIGGMVWLGIKPTFKND